MSSGIDAAEQQKILGNDEFNAKNFDKAIEHYSEAIRLDPENHIYYSNRSAAYGASGQWERAEEDAKLCVQKNPSFAKGYHRLANAQKYLGKPEEASATLRSAPPTRRLSKEDQESKTNLMPRKGSGPSVLTPAVMDELRDLQPQLVSIQRELEMSKASLTSLEQQKRRLALVAKELEALPEQTKTYQSVGKMFVRADMPSNLKHLQEENSSIEKTISKVEVSVMTSWYSYS
uniref:Uncharacterized protein AlNc14C251G9655 n=1 Tax=Albugo laibachii Nc14 TaxID=890382 RepID=F0WTH6_9STRA|nr:conserved hypothetical protein [Albugo laibachii Nc14]|eukprot:CCA24666.1 conserved hypothetical protein [Albugo laibachii Nc14]